MERHPLDGVYAKLDRAGEHLDAMDDEWREIIDRNIKQFLATPELDLKTGWYTFKVGDFDPDMLPFAIGCGEIAYQLRSALEHKGFSLQGLDVTLNQPSGQQPFARHAQDRSWHSPSAPRPVAPLDSIIAAAPHPTSIAMRLDGRLDYHA